MIYSKENPDAVTTAKVPSNQDLIVTTLINRGDGNGPERIKSDILNIDRGQTETVTAVYPNN